MKDPAGRKEYQGASSKYRSVALTDETVFRDVFGVPGCEDLLKGLLNAVFGPRLKGRPIEKLSLFKRTEDEPNPRQRPYRPDIIATDQLDRLFNIEMQDRRDDFRLNRMMTQLSRLVVYCPPKDPDALIRQIYYLSFGEGPLPGLEDYPEPVVYLRNKTDQKGNSLAGALPETVYVNLSHVRKVGRKLRISDFDDPMKWCYCIAVERIDTDGDARMKLDGIIASEPLLRSLHNRYLEAALCGDEALALQMIQNFGSDAKYAGELATAKQDDVLMGKREAAIDMRRHRPKASSTCECAGSEQSDTDNP